MVYVHIVIYYQVGGVTHQQIAVYDLSCTVSILRKLIPGVYLDCVVYVHIVIYYQVGGVTHQQIAVYEEFARGTPGFSSAAPEGAQGAGPMVKPQTVSK